MEDLYNNIHLHPMPDTHNLTDKTDKELNALLNPKYNFNILLASLIEKIVAGMQNLLSCRTASVFLKTKPANDRDENGKLSTLITTN